MFAECFDLGPQYKMVSVHSWISGSLSQRGKTYAYKMEVLCKPEGGVVTGCFRTGHVAVRFEEVSGFSEQSNTCCIFLPPQQPPHPTCWDAELSLMLHMKPSRLSSLLCCFSGSCSFVFIQSPLTLRALAVYPVHLSLNLYNWYSEVTTKFISVSFVPQLDFKFSEGRTILSTSSANAVSAYSKHLGKASWVYLYVIITWLCKYDKAIHQ